jgi:hypothetical protein
VGCGVLQPTTEEHTVFAIIGTWPVEGPLDAAALEHIAANVSQQAGFVRGFWGQEPGSDSEAHAVVVLQDEASARSMADGITAAIPSASVQVVQVLADA